jgi:diguanylate cyclase (GGDEF)-like protein
VYVRREVQSQTQQDADQSAADIDQTQADADQSASDADQSGSNSDQRLSERDQHASDRDQAAADAELIDSDTRNASREAREASSRERGSTAAARATTTAHRLATAQQRDEVARARDLTAAARDRTARTRDKAADARDRAAEGRERRAAEAGELDPGDAPLKALRLAGAALRRQAALERSAAAADRKAAAEDRDEAAADRNDAGLDELTGIFRRGTGELALAHEVDRSRRLGIPMVVAMIDVDGLKVINDKQGHASGDALLRDVVSAITSTTRSYDVTMRWGGDEFVCALSDVSLEVAAKRTGRIQSALEELRHGASLSTGLAELHDDDSLETLIGRADADLYRLKHKRFKR